MNEEKLFALLHRLIAFVRMDLENQEDIIFNDVFLVNHLWFRYVRGAVWIHNGLKVWPPPDCHTLTYLQQDSTVSVVQQQQIY